MRMAICWTILMPVCLACQLFLLLQTALRKGSRAGMPSAEATTANARAVVLRTYLKRFSGYSSAIPHLLIDIIDVRSHRGNHSGESCSLGQIGNDLPALNSCVVVLVDEKRLDDDENLVDVGTDQVVQFVENSVNHLQMIVFEQIQFHSFRLAKKKQLQLFYNKKFSKKKKCKSAFISSHLNHQVSFLVFERRRHEQRQNLVEQRAGAIFSRILSDLK